ncbi:MAG: hypothetical protein HY059_10890 [Proteobacteria bacterium]|nr:hypothetical protein [Pseudomonadota bacterium]
MPVRPPNPPDPAPGQRYVARELCGADVLRAFPLARLAAGHLTLAEWRHFAAAMGAGRVRRAAAGRADRGLLALEDSRGYLQALCSFAVRPDLAAGRRLDIDNIVTLDLVDSDGPASAMIGSIERLARELGCPAFAIRLPPGRTAAGASRHALDAVLGTSHDQSGVYRRVDAAK